jgi:predicted permease
VNIELKFALSMGLILLSMAAGYFARRSGRLQESFARRMMTVVLVAGYPGVGFLAIWKIQVQWCDAWLPVLGFVQATVLALTALGVGRWLLRERLQRGMVGLACGVGNHGVTMAGFVVFLLFGDYGLGLNTIYALYTFFALVLLSYTIAQRYAQDVAPQPILKLMIRNLLHWRASGLYACTAAILLGSFGVARPGVFDAYPILDIMVYMLIAAAYFAVGLRLHLPHLMEIKRAVLMVLVVRHGVGLGLGFALAGLTYLTPWPLEGLARDVFIIQASVPIGVMGVAVANMFHIKPQQASALFVVSSLGYLLIGIPLVLWVFG